MFYHISLHQAYPHPFDEQQKPFSLARAAELFAKVERLNEEIHTASFLAVGLERLSLWSCGAGGWARAGGAADLGLRAGGRGPGAGGRGVG